MGGAREHLRAVTACIAALGVLAGACGGEPRLPDGDPVDIVAAAPDKTLAESPVQVEISRPTGRSSTTVDLHDDGEPAAILDLVRGAESIDPFGGQRVRGVGALRYDLDFDVSVAAARTPEDRRAAVEALAPESGPDLISGAVWVDRKGRILRVMVPEPLFGKTRPTFPSGAPYVVTYDYFGWT